MRAHNRPVGVLVRQRTPSYTPWRRVEGIVTTEIVASELTKALPLQDARLRQGLS